MTYSETLEYMFSKLPMYHRIGSAAYKANLNNTIDFSNYLGKPEKKFKSVHIAGTNGKGSVSHMIASILQEAGCKTGLYTSPHLIDFRERIKINGQMIPEEYVVSFIKKHKDFIDKTQPSFFEMTVAMAFQFFADSNVEFAVIETGLGGRLDSTNIITPLLSVITNISYDHTALLGDTLEKIALEKAGIIKPHIPAVVGETDNATSNVFIEKAKQNNSELVFADQIFEIINANHNEQFGVNKNGKKHIEKIVPDLKGIYQKKNIKTVLAALEFLSAHFRISEERIISGIENTVRNTGLLGRWQTIGNRPLIVCDTGHNESGIEEVVNQISLQQYEQLHFIFGIVNDKDSSAVLQKLPQNAKFYFTRASIPRALSEITLASEAKNYGLNGNTFPDVASAYKSAIENASARDMIFIGGSTFVVADILKYLMKEEEL